MALVAVEVGSSVCFLGFLKNIFYVIHMKFFITFSWQQHDKNIKHFYIFGIYFVVIEQFFQKKYFSPAGGGGGERFFRSNWTFCYLTTHNIFTLNRDLKIVRKYL